MYWFAQSTVQWTNCSFQVDFKNSPIATVYPDGKEGLSDCSQVLLNQVRLQLMHQPKQSKGRKFWSIWRGRICKNKLFFKLEDRFWYNVICTAEVVLIRTSDLFSFCPFFLYLFQLQVNQNTFFQILPLLKGEGRASSLKLITAIWVLHSPCLWTFIYFSSCRLAYWNRSFPLSSGSVMKSNQWNHIKYCF